MAIHGFSRMHSWEVVETSDNRVHVRDEVHSADHPYSYRLDQIIDIAPDGFRISLSIQNEGDSALPFGIGLHPWFSKTNKATLEFQSMAHHSLIHADYHKVSPKLSTGLLRETQLLCQNCRW